MPTDTDVGVMPVWSLNAEAGMVDLDDETEEGAALVDEQAVRAAATTTAHQGGGDRCRAAGRLSLG